MSSLLMKTLTEALEDSSMGMDISAGLKILVLISNSMTCVARGTETSADPE